MAKFFSLLSGLTAKKYAPQPPEIDYKPPEVYRVEPVDGRLDDSASLTSEYCDPEDVVRDRDVLHSDSEYSVPFESTGVYSSPASAVGVGEHAPSIAEGPKGVSGLYRGSPIRHLPDSPFAAATEVSSSVLRDVSHGYQQHQQQQPQIGGPSVGSGDNEDYDCPWDKGDIESEVYRMVQERQSRTSDSAEPDSCNLSGRSVGFGRSLSVSSSASWSSANQFTSGPGVGGLASPTSAVLGDDGTSTAAAGNCSGEPACADSSPGASTSQQQQLSFGNADYFDEVLNLDDPSREIWASVPTSTTAISSGAAKADCRKPIAMPRGDRRVRPQPNSSQCYVNLTPVALSAPPARALPSPAVASLIRPPAEAEGDLSVGLYDDPWDMRKVEEELLARDLELRSPSAAFGATAARAPPLPFGPRSDSSCVGVSTESAEPDLSVAGIERGRRALSDADANDPAANATAASSSGLQSSKSVLALAAAFDGGAKAVGPPRSLPLLRSSSCNDDQSPSDRTCGPSPLVPSPPAPLSDASTSGSLQRPRPAAAKAAAGGSGCDSSSNSSVVAVAVSPPTTLPRLHVVEKERLGADRRFEPAMPAHTAAVLPSAAASGLAKAGVGCVATKVGGAGVTTKLPSETLSPRTPAGIATQRSPVMATDRRAEAAAAVSALPSSPIWRKAAGAVADQDEAGTARTRCPASPLGLNHSRPTIGAESGSDARTPRAAAAEPAAGNALAAASGSGAKLGQAAAISPAEKSTAAVPSVEKQRGAQQPLMQQRWFHGDITRQKAEELLANEPEGSFLVRMSSSGNKEYSLSFRVPTLGVIHLKITATVDGAYILGQFGQPFNTIADLIGHYSSNVVPLRHAEHVKLGKAICRRPP